MQASILKSLKKDYISMFEDISLFRKILGFAVVLAPLLLY